MISGFSFDDVPVYTIVSIKYNPVRPIIQLTVLLYGLLFNAECLVSESISVLLLVSTKLNNYGFDLDRYFMM